MSTPEHFRPIGVLAEEIRQHTGAPLVIVITTDELERPEDGDEATKIGVVHVFTSSRGDLDVSPEDVAALIDLASHKLSEGNYDLFRGGGQKVM